MSAEVTGYAKIIHLLQVAVVVRSGHWDSLLCVLFFQGVSHTLSHLSTPAWQCLRCPQVPKVSTCSWQIWLMVRGQAGYCQQWQVAASTCVYATNPCSQITNASSYSSQITLSKAINYVKQVLPIFMSSRLNHGLGHKTEFIGMAAFWCIERSLSQTHPDLLGWN